LVVSDSYNDDPSCAGAPRTFARLKFVAAIYDGMDVASRGLTNASASNVQPVHAVLLAPPNHLGSLEQ